MRGQRREIGQTTLSAADVREMPGAFGDPFRAIEALPGGLPRHQRAALLLIRGAPPNDNGYYVDGVRVPFLFHVGIGEAVIHPALIDRVDFFPSRRAGRLRRMQRARHRGADARAGAGAHGEANLRLFDARRARRDAVRRRARQLPPGGTIRISGSVLSAITRQREAGLLGLSGARDLAAGDRDTLGVFAFGSHDYLGTALVLQRPGGADRRAARVGLPPRRPALRPRADRRHAADRRRRWATTHRAAQAPRTRRSPRRSSDSSAASALELDEQAFARRFASARGASASLRHATASSKSPPTRQPGACPASSGSAAHQRDRRSVRGRRVASGAAGRAGSRAARGGLRVVPVVKRPGDRSADPRPASWSRGCRRG